MRILPAWLPLLLPLALAGCGETMWRDLLPRFGPPGFAADGAEATPAAGPALQLSLGGRQARAALLQQTGGRRLWRTAGGVVVATDGARVVATAGLSPTLVATRFDGPDPLANPVALLAAAAPARRLVDLMERERDPAGMRFGLSVTCRMAAQRLEDQEGILLLEERCQAEGSRGFTNRFWAEAESGTVRHSEQWIGPGLPMLALTMPME
jgi:hypothetical protein